MLTGEMAKYQIQDRVREAEAFRMNGSTWARRRRAERGRAPRIAAPALAAVLWPVKL